MSPELKEYEAKVLKLPVEDRAILAEHLIASLDSIEDSENEQLWVKEAERRYQQYKSGNISARPASDVIRDARNKIK
jgi:putative addiction module component (TIGR02574 family)